MPYPSANTGGRRYILPWPHMHHGGLYEYVLVSVPQARQWVKDGPYVSYVTQPEWAWMLEKILSPLQSMPIPHVPTGRPLPVLGYADDALVFTPAGGDIPGVRWDRDRKHSAALVAQELFTFGVFRRLS